MEGFRYAPLIGMLVQSTLTRPMAQFNILQSLVKMVEVDLSECMLAQKVCMCTQKVGYFTRYMMPHSYIDII
jgi:hypothetical protein